ncbi:MULTISPECIES: glutaredoxin family protein [Brevibacillus]|uniref:Glutaredoxin n=1 Tax=Brevibacillus porteri TaxID=2126350 RepID=A0ABX5FSU2_9BACL|nr:MULTISPECIES: glutaredoxin [Brevibacillus]MDC0759601.1 glutaredoxin [Brevibacillus sp. AG]MED1799278.1 glutaredoxin [Brevibacillus porteri]MED2132334.1 glutaredoxin [Brevibacillus porteri]MED2744418.1 glutaredoxin [Brevibacillus porteri]MED2814862.1 glutaredoxin [Brevibacillus porteri]
MSAKQKVIVWGRSGCSFCTDVKAILQANQRPFEWIDVEGKDVLRDVLEVKYGTRLVPVVEIGGDGKYEALLHTELDQLQSRLSVGRGDQHGERTSD